MRKKDNLPVILILTLIVIAGALYFYFRQSLKINLPGKSNQIIQNATTPNTIDEITTSFRETLAAKYDKNVANVTVTINKREGDFITGVFSFGSTPGQAAQFLAAKIVDVWKIIFDGNGLILCSVVDPVNFPVDMQTQCFDSAKNVWVDRGARTGMFLQQ